MPTIPFGTPVDPSGCLLLRLDRVAERCQLGTIECDVVMVTYQEAVAIMMDLMAALEDMSGGVGIFEEDDREAALSGARAVFPSPTVEYSGGSSDA